MTQAKTRTFDNSVDHLLRELQRITRVLEGYQTVIQENGGPSRPLDSLEPGTAPQPTDLPLSVPGDVRRTAAAMEDDIQTQVQATEGSLRLQHLVDVFDLAPQHRDVLLLALLPTAYPHYQEVFTELQNDLSATQPSVGLMADLFSDSDAEYLAATRLVGPESPLRRHDIVTIGEPEDTRMHRTSRPVFVEDRIESYLFGHESIDPLLEDVLDDASVETSLADLRLDDERSGRLGQLRANRESDRSQRFYLYGPDGTEKRGAVEAVIDADRVLRGHLADILAAGAVQRARREAMLLDQPVHLEGVTRATEPDNAPTLDDVLDEFASFQEDLYLTGTEEWTPDRTTAGGIDAIVEFTRPEFDIRKEFWAEHADKLPEGLEPTVLAGIFELTQGQLETALATAESLAGSGDLTAEHIYRGCSSQSAGELGELAEQLEPDSDWEDIELPDNTMRGLQTVASHVTHKGRIYAEWAFEKRFSRGNGVVALFSGPSGTGKTMAAEIIAQDVGMRLYKIDLSSVVSKYIGETEENLEQIFTEAEHSNAILLFDEADAVFGDRAGVSDATDRYANVEVNYLLQRIESYNGVVLLTTNYESNIDSAFMRRIDHNVAFRRPQEETRRKIWDGIFPDETPVGDLDYEFLSSFRLTGGDIRTIAQTAAILGAADERKVTMKHVVRGLQRELQKSGKMVDPQEFEEYREYLQLD